MRLTGSKKRLREAIGQSSAANRLLPLLSRARRRKGAIVLMYHSVALPEQAAWIDPANHVPADVFEQQMQFLTDRRTVIPLERLIETVRSSKSPPPGSVAITFDDGYLDNLTVAAPILDRLRLPATIFLATNYIERGKTQWIDEAYSIFRNRTHHQLSWPIPDSTTHNLSDDDVAEQAYNAVCADLLTARPQRRESLLDALREQLRPTGSPPRLTLDWSDVADLVTRYPRLSLGGHSVHHSDLSAMEVDEAVAEIAHSNEAVSKQTGNPARLFSFPYGRATNTLRDAAASIGIVGACGGGSSCLINSTTNPMALARVPAPRSLDRFEFLTSAANTGIMHRLFN